MEGKVIVVSCFGVLVEFVIGESDMIIEVLEGFVYIFIEVFLLLIFDLIFI